MHSTPFAWMRVGHWTDDVSQTGCTVIRFLGDVVASGEVRGGAPATREFALLEPTRLVESIDAVCLSGGSAFGLATADGVVQSLRREGFGFKTAHGVVPIVIGMSLYDLGVGSAVRWPGSPEGIEALEAADRSFATGLVGAGTGATTGKWRGPDEARPGGLSFAVATKGELVVCALVAVNAVGDIASSERGSTIRSEIAAGTFDWPASPSPLLENTTIGVIATNGRFTKTQCRSLAEAGHDGLGRAIVPAHGPGDGDALVVVSKPEVEADLASARLLTEVAVESAISAITSSP
ncbi:MAG: L-aminopeptidase/D-esterase-like protein [Verrucomicrobiales bacterium]|jgi:L-aminopeptidase/D-esterase-like protein